MQQSEELDGLPARKRQGLVPDGMVVFGRGAFSRVLWELKMLHQTRGNHPPSTRKEHGGAVERRARRINKEIKRDANKADVKYNGWDPASEQWGPLRTRLEQFGHVLEFCVGPRGGFSSDLRKFIKKISLLGAERKWRLMGARSLKEAAGVIKARITRSLAISAVIQEEYLRHDRLGRFLGDDKAATERRNTARAAHWTWRNEFGQRNGPRNDGDGM